MTPKMMTGWLCLFGAILILSLTGLPARGAEEVSLGKPVTKQDAGLAITAAFAAPFAVEGNAPSGQPLFLAPEKADRFLTIDVQGAKGNKNGFGAGEFVPYLSVAYSLLRQGSSQAQQGQLQPLVTRQGMRYGNNVKLARPGTYTLTLTIEPPIKVGFGRHTDIETGVSRWWKPFQVEWTTKYPPSAK